MISSRRGSTLHVLDPIPSSTRYRFHKPSLSLSLSRVLSFPSNCYTLSPIFQRRIYIHIHTQIRRVLREKRRKEKRKRYEISSSISTFTIRGSVRKSTRGSSREDGGFRAESVSGRVGREGEKGDGCRNACPPVVGPFARIPCGPSMSPLFLNLAVRIQIRSFRIGRRERGEESRGGGGSARGTLATRRRRRRVALLASVLRIERGRGGGKRDARGVTLCARRHTERRTTTGNKIFTAAARAGP